MGHHKKPTSILLFAAGLGTRMGALVADRPKPLVKVGDITLLDHALELVAETDLETKAVNVHYRADLIRAHLTKRNVLISDETNLLRETGGGLKHALPLLDGSYVVTMNTDAIWSNQTAVTQILDAWRPDMNALLMTVPVENAHGHLGKGDFQMDDRGHLHRGPGDIYTGLQIINTDILHDVKDDVFSMNVVWDMIAERGPLHGVRYGGQWCDVGRPESIEIAKDMLAHV